MDMMKVKIWLRRLTGLFITVILLAALAIAAGTAWLSGESGRSWLAAQIETRLSTEERTVDIGEIRALTSGRAVISSLAISEKGQPLLAAEDIRLVYDWRDFLALNPYLQALRIKELALYSLPETKKETEPKDFTLSTLPDFQIGDFRIETLTLAPSFTGEEEKLAVKGAFVSRPQIYHSRFALVVTDLSSDKTLASLSFNPNRDDRTLQLAVAVDDPGTGPLARLLEQEEGQGEGPFHIGLKGKGPLSDWRGRLDASWGAIGADVAMTLDASDKAVRLITEGRWHMGETQSTGKTILHYNTASGDATLEFKGDLIVAGYRIEGLATTLTAEPEAALLDPQKAVMISASGTIERLLSLPDRKPVAYGTDITFDTRLRLKGQKIEIAELVLKQALGELKVKGGIDRTEKMLDLTGWFNTQDIARLRPSFKGAAEGTISLKGRYAPFNLSGTLSVDGKDITVPVQRLSALLGPTPEVTTKFSYTPDGGLSLKEGKVRGNKTIELEGGFAPGKPIGFDIKTDYAGYDIAFHYGLKDKVMSASDLVATGPAGTITGDLSFDMADGTLGGTLALVKGALYDLTLELGGTPEKPLLEGTITGQEPYPYQLSYKGYGALSPRPQLVLTTLEGQVAGNELALTSPQAVLALADGGLLLEPVTLAVAGGTLQAEGQYSSEAIRLALEADTVSTDWGIAPLTQPGRMSGTLSLGGPVDALTGQARIDLMRLVLPGPEAVGEQVIEGRIEAGYENEKLALTANLSGPAGLALTGQGALPLTLIPFSLPSEAPLQGSVKGQVSLQAVANLFGLDRHRLRGAGTIDAILAGTVANPALDGTVSVADGYYENIMTGTVIENVAAQARLDKALLVIESFTGKDLDGGRISGTGTVTFTGEKAPVFDIALTTERFEVVNRAVLGVMASAEVTFKGDREAAEIAGDIEIDEAEYYLSGFAQTPGFAGFTIVETGGEEQPGPPDEELVPQAYRMDLDLMVKADNNIFVRSPELDSEWEADLTLGGTVNKPRVRGTASLIRGRYEMAGTTVRLQEGTLRFVNPDPAAPLINIKGEVGGADVDAIITLTGSAKDPIFTLTSDPVLPEDEIMARILFGRSLDQVSPLQALRIAQMLAALSGSGGEAAMFDPVNDIRKGLGLDDLDVRMDEEGGATLSAGKYLDDDIYVAVDQGVTPGSAAVRAEIKVTDEIEVETRFNSTQESSVGVNWKRDY